MDQAEFEDRLHELLDARHDPLADPQCADFLAEHPQQLDAYARLCERCAVLPWAVPEPAGRPRWRRPLPWLLLAGAAVAAITLPPGVPAAAAPPAAGRVLAASQQPIRATLQPVATVRARSVLLAGPDAHLETFEQWSAP